MVVMHSKTESAFVSRHLLGKRPNADIRHPTSVYALRHPSPELRNPILRSFVSFIVRGPKEGCRRDGYTHPASRRQGSEGPVTQEETL
jgi:hypothetical protein